MMRKTAIILAILLFGTITATSYAAAPPSEDEGKKAIQEQAPSHNIQITSFKKTDGKMGTQDGISIYEMYYEVNAKGLVNKGKKISGKGSIVFEKRESGWVSTEVKGLPTDDLTYTEKLKADSKVSNDFFKKKAEEMKKMKPVDGSAEE